MKNIKKALASKYFNVATNDFDSRETDLILMATFLPSHVILETALQNESVNCLPIVSSRSEEHKGGKNERKK